MLEVDIFIAPNEKRSRANAHISKTLKAEFLTKLMPDDDFLRQSGTGYRRDRYAA